ncbi:uncharacterized protein LOC135082677 [Ostrinia nubilalis]|uniref:pollen-specific leucine-rich repeat extensin-like protein 2 n=2 Tax=Ostrinia TaxID=29056 RepID=UPI0010401E61|nr:pollen-specific leucine-rich repeat extensin-like protein 2 [Ostrinia furnacalis]
MACSKEKEVLFNVLDLYRDMPYLWQKSHKDYSNQPLRTEGFRVLLEIYKNFDEKATVKTIKKKLMNMRTNYNKELAKVNASKQTGAGTDDAYVPTLWYYDALNFLGSRSKPCRITPESIEDEEGSNSSDEDISSQQIQGSIPSTSRGHSVKKKKETLLQKQEKIIKSAEVMLSNKEEEDWEVFGKSVGLQLKDINGTQLIFTQKIISDVIFNAKLGRLSEDSCLLVTPSEIRHTLNRYNYQIPFIQSPASSYSSPSPYNRQSPKLPHKRPSSRNYLSPTPSPPSSSTTQYHPPHPIQFPQQAFQSSQQAIQSPQQTIQLPKHTIQSSQHIIQSPQPAIQSPQHSFPSRITVNNPDDFSEYIGNESVSTISPKLPHKRPSSRNYSSPTPSPPSSSTTQYHPPHPIQFPQPFQSSQQAIQSPQQTIQLPQHTIQSSQHTIQSSQHIIQSPQPAIQSPQHSFPSRITVNNPEDFLEYIENESGSTVSPSIVEGSANVMKDFLIFKPKKE